MRISANKLREAILHSPSLQRALLGFAHAFMNRTANTHSPTAPPLWRNDWQDGCSWRMTVSAEMKYLSPMNFCH